MRVLCELSGGADSAYAALLAKQKWPDAEFHSLFIDYGQPYQVPEFACSVGCHKALQFPPQNWDSIRILGLYHLRGSKEVNIPLRNLVISAVAAAKAEQIKAEIVVVGSKSLVKDHDDPFSFKDSTREFYNDIEQLVISIEETKHLIRFEPMLSVGREKKMEKLEVYYGLWGAGFQYGDTFSCWFPGGDLTIEGKECGRCRNCLEKKQIWDEWKRQEYNRINRERGGTLGPYAPPIIRDKQMGS